MKYLTLTGKTHTFRAPVTQAILSIKKTCSDGDILLCQHFPKDAESIHKVQMHDFYASKRRSVPSVAASYVNEGSIPIGMWSVFIIESRSPHRFDLKKCLDVRPGALEFRSGHDEMRIAKFLRHFFEMCKGKRVKYDRTARKFEAVV
uniref:Uncharacterized protein n=1 Tax=Paramoeba aestuarina TaxID=180227 RepID=A0A7S4NKU7_9EUKA|mmetsp:Transcript_18675/g.29285  ORF Transcript_18675/g.29285 Transcript_18675/m.29285 type:complete len:147 (+) Transcript_18675:60-500(+)